MSKNNDSIYLLGIIFIVAFFAFILIFLVKYTNHNNYDDLMNYDSIKEQNLLGNANRPVRAHLTDKLKNSNNKFKSCFLIPIYDNGRVISYINKCYYDYINNSHMNNSYMNNTYNKTLRNNNYFLR